MTDTKGVAGRSPVGKALTKKTSPSLTQCALCDKAFRKTTKLQRHMLEQHLVAVSVPVDGSKLEDGQRRAYSGVHEALAAANTAMQNSHDGKGIQCPQCPSDRKSKVFKTALDLASHTISKHCDGLSDQGSDDDEPDAGLSSPVSRLMVPQEQNSGSELSERVSVSRKRGPAAATGADKAAKRTKLLCVDVTNPSAIAPESKTLPNPPSKPKSLTKTEPEVVAGSGASCAEDERADPQSRAASAPGDNSEDFGKKTARSRRDVLAVQPGTMVANFSGVAKNLGENAGSTRAAPSMKAPFAKNQGDVKSPCFPAGVEKNHARTAAECPRVSASKPPRQGTKRLSSSPETAGAATSKIPRMAMNDDVIPSSQGRDAQREAEPAVSPARDAPLTGPITPDEDAFVVPKGLSSRVPALGFDIDFADMCDFPSSVEGAYYRSRARKVQTGGL